MAQGDKKHFGKGTQGKGSGAGALTELDKEMVGENDILSNRDKKQHSRERGQDGNAIKTDQEQDHAANRRAIRECGCSRCRCPGTLAGALRSARVRARKQEPRHGVYT